jgi:hypothetical protein
MSTTKTVSSESVKNNGGTVVAGGTAASDSPITNVINTNELNTGNEYGSKVLEKVAAGTDTSDPHGVITAKAGGTGGLAYYPDPYAQERNFILRGAGDSASKINNDTVSFLNVPGARFAGVGEPSIHKLLTTRKLGVMSYNILAVPSTSVVPGRTKGAGNGDLVTYVSTTGNVPATDDAASPTRTVPGELTYHFGKIAQPYNDVYKAKDQAES